MKARLLVVVPYACARVPLGILESTLVRRLPVASAVRIGFDCALGALDMWTGQILQDPRISFHGYQRVGNAVHQLSPELRVAAPRTARRPAPPRGYASTRAWTAADRRGRLAHST